VRADSTAQGKIIIQLNPYLFTCKRNSSNANYKENKIKKTNKAQT
jgi:hypothetical protein